MRLLLLLPPLAHVTQDLQGNESERPDVREEEVFLADHGGGGGSERAVLQRPVDLGLLEISQGRAEHQSLSRHTHRQDNNYDNMII